MEQGGTALDRARDELDHGHLEQLWRFDDTTLLHQAAVAQQLINRLHGIHLGLVAEAESREMCERDGWSVANVLVEHQPQALRTAKATVLLATELAEHDQVGAALRAGDVSVNQAKAVVQGLKELPGDLPEHQVAEVEAALVEHAKTFDPAALRRIANRMIEVIRPDTVDEKLAAALEREAAQAERDRYLSWSYTGRGSVELRGRLPLVDGEALIEIISAHVEAVKIALDKLDPDTAPPSLAQRRADALVTIISRHQQAQLAPDHGGDRPRVNITLRLDDLIRGVRGATLTGTCEMVSPGEARRLACDADLIPAVLGAESAVLDLGRQKRLFCGDLRRALVLRDGGCVFPFCDRPPRDCEAHHIVPWWSGGPTSLANGVLFCPHHHRTVEPDPHAPPGTRWQIRLDHRRLPELIPPTRFDPTRRARRHQRFAERDLLSG